MFGVYILTIGAVREDLYAEEGNENVLLLSTPAMSTWSRGECSHSGGDGELEERCLPIIGP